MIQALNSYSSRNLFSNTPRLALTQCIQDVLSFVVKDQGGKFTTVRCQAPMLRMCGCLPLRPNACPHSADSDHSSVRLQNLTRWWPGAASRTARSCCVPCESCLTDRFLTGSHLHIILLGIWDSGDRCSVGY